MKMRKRIIIIWLLLIGTSSCLISKNSVDGHSISDDIISVEYPEVYELANVVLALTEYGITDPWQVRKDIAYYDEMRVYFKPYMDHPLLDSVNFSRERWQEYLSYRTDSYAFELDDDYKLSRKNDFQSFEIRTFDKYKELTADFARKSKFKTFFKEHQGFYKKVIENYQNEYLLREMKDFLTEEFGDFFTGKKYSVVISPFVYAQNLHRDIDTTWTADFPTVAKQIIEGTGFENKEDKSTEVHTLFTEMDHGYVNPTSSQYEVTTQFDEKMWDRESGYAGSTDAVFNEYMTWAVFDIFNSKYFPEFADKVNLNWHFQNDTRGFKYSYFFANKLKEVYDSHKGNKKIKDLYPEMLAWAHDIQSQLSKPKMTNYGDTLRVSSEKNTISLQFSEPMEKVMTFDLVLQSSQWDRETININHSNNLTWDENGESLSFEMKLPEKEQYYLLLNWWGVQNPLTSKKGITLQATSGFVVRGNSAQNKD